MMQAISLLVENKPGVLARITGMFTSRGFNIESLTMAPAEEPGLTRITVLIAGCNENQRVQLVKQLEKIVHVVEAVDLSAVKMVPRELALVKIDVAAEQQINFLNHVNAIGAHLVESAPPSYTVELVGDGDTLSEHISSLKKFGKLKVARSGMLAMVQGQKDAKVESVKS